jgi:hypothetical protein
VDRAKARALLHELADELETIAATMDNKRMHGEACEGVPGSRALQPPQPAASSEGSRRC